MLEEHSELESNVMGTIKQGKFHLNEISWSSENIEWLRKVLLNFAFSVGLVDGNKESTHSAKVKLHRVSLKILVSEESSNFDPRILFQKLSVTDSDEPIRANEEAV